MRRSAVLLGITFLLGITGIALLCGCEHRPDAWDRQVAAVRAGTSDAVRVNRGRVTGERFRDLASGCDGLRTLAVARGGPGSAVADMTAADLAAFASLRDLRELRLDAPLTDDAAEHVAELDSLERLNLPRARLTDAGLDRIAAGCPRLSLVRLSSPAVTDAGVATLCGLPRLRNLHLIDVPVTDAAVDALAGCETLESLYVDGGRVGRAGWVRFAESRPDVHLHVDGGHP